MGNGKKRVRKKLRRKKLMDQLRDMRPDWTEFEPARLADEDLERYVNSANPDEKLVGVWLNSRYQVLVFDVEVEALAEARAEAGEDDDQKMQHLSIKRLDREPMHDWRDLQRIKNEICGTEREAVEIYPAESRLLDSSNQYHLWVLPEGHHLPFGYHGGRAVSESAAFGNKQRPFEKKPDDMITEEDIRAYREAKRKGKDNQ